MRWYWLDRFLEFTSGRRAVAIKNVTLGEESLDDYYPGFPVLPPSLIVEGLAQAGGLLVGELSQFRERVVLAKINRVVFFRPVFPGDRLTYSADMLDCNPQGAIVQGQAAVDGDPVADMELVFAHLDDRFPRELFGPDELREFVDKFRLYDVARDEEGNRIPFPAYLRRA
ncbi:MAG: beta-hydroxyacyl-ACP dehydratase [Planctomycetes bacterium]|nr:beta-hydroxyacyl-ACP dehydratase [Planctomycetota bacterium]